MKVTHPLWAISVCSRLVTGRYVHSQTQSEQLTLQDDMITFRDALESDIDDITTVIIDAFGPGADHQYTMPEQNLYPNNVWHCTRDAIAVQWQNLHNTTIAKVVSVKLLTPDSKTGKTDHVIALGVWHILNRTDSESHRQAIPWPMLPYSCHASKAAPSGGSDDEPPYDCSKMLGYNMTRAVDFNQKFHAAKVQNIDEAYDQQLYLNVLATHPDWDGHGFAAMNCHWGEKLAQSLKIPLTLIATPVGYPLYHSLGWQSVKNLTIEKLDGLGSLWYEVMQYAV